MHKTVFGTHSNNFKTDFLKLSVLRISKVALLFMVPLALIHIISGQFALSLVLCIAIAINVFHVWSISQRNLYYSQLTLILLLPVAIASIVLLVTNEGVVGLFSCFSSLLSFYFVLPERQARFANLVIVCVGLPLAWQVLEINNAISFTAILLLVSFFSAIFVNVIYKQQEDLRLQAVTDSLTGLFNRTSLFESLDQAIEQHRRQGIAMSIITLDIDHFKSINDTYGHNIGDDVLRKFGELLKNRARRTDKVFRLGGEEFMVLLFGTELEQAIGVAEELRLRVDSTPFLPNHSVTISLGVAMLGNNENSVEWMRRSDEYLYSAKNSGRNKVTKAITNTANTTNTVNDYVNVCTA